MSSLWDQEEADLDREDTRELSQDGDGGGGGGKRGKRSGQKSRKQKRQRGSGGGEGEVEAEKKQQETPADLLLPYPCTAQADETATPYTPFARSFPVPVLSTDYETHEARVRAHIEQANNPNAPTKHSQDHIKNKMVRSARWDKLKMDQRKEKNKARKAKKKARGVEVKRLVDSGVDKATAKAQVESTKQVPRTVESMRVFDETLVLGDDLEALQELDEDEFGKYFATDEVMPKVIFTTSIKPSMKGGVRLIRELEDVIPNSKYFERRNYTIAMICEGAIKRNFTDIIIVNESRRQPDHLIHVHLPDGPTAYYRLTSIKYRKEIEGSGAPSNHTPELILNNFNTRLGHTLGRMFASLFPKAPEFHGRRVVTFHNQRDFIFFRHHRYIFESTSEARLQECGPRLTLKLEKLQKGLFDPFNEEYIWIWKPREMGKKKKDIHL